MAKQQTIAIIGAGSWGTALAISLAHRHPVILWGHSSAEMDPLAQDREHKAFLPGIAFPDNLKVSTNLQDTLNQANQVLVVVPSHAFSSVCQQIADLRPSLDNLAWATKGFDPATQQLLSDVAEKHFPQAQFTVVSGPSFAGEVAKGLPTALTVASNGAKTAETWAELLRSDNFRPYISHDLIGVQVGGASKNVMAIAAGISDGLGFGANARSALITRGLAEIMRLGGALGAQNDTFMGLAGLGDLTLTCTDNQSRNRRMGLALAQGLSVADAKASIGQEVEGINTAREVWQLAQRLKVEMPITEQTYKVLYEGLEPKLAVQNLLSRDVGKENS
jgi:glycerol-3-phosphate dehydrogenase (NAD(P)+)